MSKQVFISYSTKDQAKVRQVKQHLEQRGIPCWMADNCIHSGEQFKTVIVKAIKQCDVFLFFSSEEANRSEWTIKEINTAVHLSKPIVPVKLDDAPYNDSILFDIGCLDYTDLSSITKLKPVWTNWRAPCKVCSRSSPNIQPHVIFFGSSPSSGVWLHCCSSVASPHGTSFCARLA